MHEDKDMYSKVISPRIVKFKEKQEWDVKTYSFCRRDDCLMPNKEFSVLLNIFSLWCVLPTDVICTSSQRHKKQLLQLIVESNLLYNIFYCNIQMIWMPRRSCKDQSPRPRVVMNSQRHARQHLQTVVIFHFSLFFLK